MLPFFTYFYTVHYGKGYTDMFWCVVSVSSKWKPLFLFHLATFTKGQNPTGMVIGVDLGQVSQQKLDSSFLGWIWSAWFWLCDTRVSFETENPLETACSKNNLFLVLWLYKLIWTSFADLTEKSSIFSSTCQNKTVMQKPCVHSQNICVHFNSIWAQNNKLL